MPEMFESAGITNTNTQLLLNAINPIFSMLGAIYGASLLDKLGRRKMMLWGLAGSLFFYILLTAFAANANANANLGYGVIVSICMQNPFKPTCMLTERHVPKLYSKIANFCYQTASAYSSPGASLLCRRSTAWNVWKTGPGRRALV